MLRDQIQEFQKNGPALIAAGMMIVLTAILYPGVPIASAVLLIGYGALLTLFARPSRQELFGLMSLTVYASLGCLAVAAQTHAATGGLGYVLMADHLLATALLALLIKTVLQRLSFSSTQ
ncbi:MAG: hypothetical protein GXP28_01565 [Planctomycetes bacterium]|nr:hypothetical protein [Planctomycetota bacterium]